VVNTKVSRLVMGIAIALAVGACSPAVAVEEAPQAPATETTQEAPAGEAPGEAMAEAMAEASQPEMGAAGGDLFQIVAGETEARFVIDEILNGAPKTVIGATGDVSGEIAADLADTSGAGVSLTVDLSGLATDNNFRNRAIHDVILQTGDADYQFATFESTGFSGLPASVEVGTSYDFQITGNLTVHGVTRELTFDATVTPVSETRLEGTASATILYEDFDVSILRLPPQVASVEDTVRLEIDIVAVR
jgi:polyisoprenoid-binding protein YceI